MENYIVAVSNSLVKASYSLDITQKRLLLCYISKVSLDHKLKPEWFYSLDLREYIKLYGLQEKTALAQVTKAISTLAERRVYLRIDEGVNDIEFNWLSCKPELLRDGYTLRIKWSKEVIPYISKLKWFFTSYPLDYVSSLRSFNALRIYEFILCELGEKPKDKPYITIENLRFMLGIDENKHTIFSNFNANVLKPAIDAINRDTYMDVEAKQYKKGKEVVGFRFIVERC